MQSLGTLRRLPATGEWNRISGHMNVKSSVYCIAVQGCNKCPWPRELTTRSIYSELPNPTTIPPSPSHGHRRVYTAQLPAAPAELDCTRCQAMRNDIPGRDPVEYLAIMAFSSKIYPQ